MFLLLVIHVVHHLFSKIWKLVPMLCFETTPFVAPYNLHIQDLIAFCNVSVRFLYCALAQRGSSCSVDRIKPAYVLADDPPSSGPSLPTPGSSRPTVTTRSGRRVHFTDFFQA
ncbi:hypothetical protein TNIN_441411 [Trichonephila inaurata madagascariensis]|uniref:Secreted protein n=1 Tax=Trichonephila inaurata madagascariensis TaxID=2747483 RepID=A0A8X7C2I7_9ARAC|nr:hypothetical protein TNIN_441411 [Trichonephila inaurata madagascariensis]